MSGRRFRVLDAVPISLISGEILEDVAEVDARPMGNEELEEEMKKDYHAVIVSTWHKVTREMIQSSPVLRVVGTASVGFDHIDVEAARERGIKIITGAGASTYAVAEHTFGLLISLARRTRENLELVRSGTWHSLATIGTELFGKTLGVVGLGRIGSCVARIARAFKMETIAYDPYVDRERAVEVGAKLVDLGKLLSSSDFLSVHLPLTTETMRMFGKSEVDAMKNGVYIVNTARGELMDESAIYEGLRSGKIAGYAADVLTGEPPTEETSPLMAAFRRGEFSNLLITSHIAGVTRESTSRYAIYVAKGVREALIEG